jgi:hypothetical protein
MDHFRHVTSQTGSKIHVSNARPATSASKLSAHRCSDFPATLHRRFDRICEISVLTADKTKVQHWHLARKGLPDDDVVEQSQSCHCQPLSQSVGKRGS